MRRRLGQRDRRVVLLGAERSALRHLRGGAARQQPEARERRQPGSRDHTAPHGILPLFPGEPITRPQADTTPPAARRQDTQAACASASVQPAGSIWIVAWSMPCSRRSTSWIARSTSSWSAPARTLACIVSSGRSLVSIQACT